SRGPCRLARRRGSRDGRSGRCPSRRRRGTFRVELLELGVRFLVGLAPRREERDEHHPAARQIEERAGRVEACGAPRRQREPHSSAGFASLREKMMTSLRAPPTTTWFCKRPVRRKPL